MSKQFRVVDCRTTVVGPAEIIVNADTAEHAARLALGEDLVRGSQQSRTLRARVYSQGVGALTMVRLYKRGGAAAEEPSSTH
ncbi:hypothetical protein [uncultured Devosia sp.]|uniref:hypothetical protein n=1 Tax=uncultured Devosia sp. TaxID=211434 RepID=UPI0035CC435F